jgi:hypothetical protein
MTEAPINDGSIWEGIMNKDIWKLRKEQGYLVNTRLIESASELFECVDYIWWKIWGPKDKAVEFESPWFRGVGRAEFKLIPSIYRENVWEYNSYDADDIRGEFPRRAGPFMEYSRFYSPGELYHIMQHYGLPTRLLDWTEGVLFALYFAIRETSANANSFTPCIWMLNPWWLNEKCAKKRNLFYSHFGKEDVDSRRYVSKYFMEEELPPYPIAVLPPHIDKRITAQKSVFTIHGRKVDGFEKLCASQKNAQLAKLYLNGKSRDTLEDQLITAGITETSVFPDLEGLAREIKREYDIR